jgi:methionyl-tRNA formyltransferase
MTSHFSSSYPTSRKKVLFFGREGCKYSTNIYNFLHHLNFNVQVVWSNSRADSLPEEIYSWQGEYIICLRSYFILSQQLIDRASIAAINFHPGPVEYPGSGCLNWALYDNAKQYGVTVHYMNSKVDNGAVIECRRFPILPQDTVSSLLSITHQKTNDLAIDTLIGLAMEGEKFLERKLQESKNEQWVGNARKMKEINELKKIDVFCTRQELEKIIRATYIFNYPPEIELHGYKFVLKLEEGSVT